MHYYLFHILQSFTLEFTNLFESALNCICTLLGRYLNESSHSESDYILHCPLLFNETSSSVSSKTLPVTLAAGALLCSAFSEQIAQTKCLVRFKNFLSSQKHSAEKQRNKKQVDPTLNKWKQKGEKFAWFSIARNVIHCKTSQSITKHNVSWKWTNWTLIKWNQVRYF